MVKAQENYEAVLNSNPPERKQFIITTRNWFGREQRWREKLKTDLSDRKRVTGHTQDEQLEAPDLRSIHDTAENRDTTKQANKYADWRKQQIDELWNALDDTTRERLIESAASSIRSNPEASRMPFEQVKMTATAVAKRACGKDLPRFDKWRQQHGSQ